MSKTIYDIDVFEYRSDGNIINYYNELFLKPLSIEENQILLDNGWKFTGHSFWKDGQLAHSIFSIRRALFGITHKELMMKCRTTLSFIKEYRKLNKS